MSTTDRTNILTWLPEAADCRFETEDDGTITCYHPSGDPRIDGLYGSGDKPVAAYAQLLRRLDDFQETQRERLDDEAAHRDSVSRDEINPRGSTYDSRSAGSAGEWRP